MRLGVALVLALVAVSPARAASTCAPTVSAGYTAALARTLGQGRDVRGEGLLRRPGAPTNAAAARGVPPLLFARTSGRRPLTRSGVYYIPSAQPAGAQGAGSPMLIVADGSEILYGSVGGPRLSVSAGGERFGSCLRRSTAARLARGYLPIVQTGYRDAAGRRYLQESFGARGPTGATAAYVRLAFAQGRVRVATSAGSHTSTHSLALRWQPGRSRRMEVIDDAAYDAARAAFAGYWDARLAEGASFVVPEARVQNAFRATVIQNLMHTWRYSLGNPYEEFSFPEGLDNAQLLAELGYDEAARAVVRTSLTRRPEPYANWKRGEKLLASAVVDRLGDDDAFLRMVTPVLRGYVRSLAAQLGSDGLLARERFSSDIPDAVFGLHAQAVAWQGLTAIAARWGATPDGRRAAVAAARLRTGIRRALARSARRLPGGALFTPMRLLDAEPAYAVLPASRDGSYWNLVAPYALASGLLTPAEQRGAFRYMQTHGSRFLGVVRAGAFALYGRGTDRSGVDQVYGVNVARLLAALDEPDQLVLSLYGQLAVAMTRETFVGGEAASLSPLGGAYYRSMYLPPNSTSNGAFLETLRSLLVQEQQGDLRLAFATPRAWLAAGRRIEVARVPVSGGRVSYRLESSASAVQGSVDAPARYRVLLRLRLPGGARIGSVTVGGRRIASWSARTGTIDLGRLRGQVEVALAR